MNVVADIFKQPWEEIDTFIDFVNDLAAGEDIGTPTFIVRNEMTGEITTALIADGSGTIVGTKMIHRVKGGLHGERHILTYRVTTTSGQQLEGDNRLIIQEVGPTVSYSDSMTLTVVAGFGQPDDGWVSG